MPHRILNKKGRKEESNFPHVYSFFTLAQIKFKFGQGNRRHFFGAHSPERRHFHIKVYRRAYNGAHQQQGSLLVAECVISLRVTEATLLRIDRPKTQQAGMLIYGLEAGQKNLVQKTS